MKLTKRIFFSLAVLLLVTDSAFCGDETNYFNRGNVKAQKGDLDGAMADYTKAIELKPDYAKAYSNRGLVKRGKGDLDGASADFNKTIELNPSLAQPYYNRGNVKAENNDLYGAIADFTKAIELKPDFAAAYDRRGTMKEVQGDLDGAIADHTKAIELNPKFFEAYNNRGYAKSANGDLDGAITDHTKAIELNPQYASAYFYRGNVKAQQSDLDGAITDHTKAIELNPKYTEAYYNRGRENQTKGNLDNALADFNKAIELNPKFADPYANRGIVKRAKGDLDGSIADFATPMKLTPKIPAMFEAKSYSTGGQPLKDDPQREAMSGQNLNTNEVIDLETAVAKNPDNLSARTKLLGYYFMRQYSSQEAKEADEKHVLWIIKNHPEAAVAGLPYCCLDPILDEASYNEAKQLWLDHTKASPTNTIVLGNAAQFFLIHNKDIAEDLLKQAQKIEPNDPEWSERLGQLYALKNGKGNSTAAKSLEEYEKAQFTDTSELSRFHRLDALAKSAFEAGEIKKASQYANELLEAAQKYPKDWNYGNAIHHGNNVLGRVALKQGDVKQADEYLLKAGQTPGSPTLDSFGPNMGLAKELLEKGEKETVLQYFELCRKFWSMGGKNLDNWTKEVNAGKVPRFGANLIY